MMWKQHWDVYVFSKWLSLSCKFFKNLTSFLCDFVTRNREYYEWFWRLRHHIQVGRFPFQGTSLGLVVSPIILESMWPTGQTSNNTAINIRWWRCPLSRDSSLGLPHPNSWIETHFVLILTKIIEHGVFLLSLSLICVQWNF